jgi:hypothetical protein
MAESAASDVKAVRPEREVRPGGTGQRPALRRTGYLTAAGPGPVAQGPAGGTTLPGAYGRR